MKNACATTFLLVLVAWSVMGQDQNPRLLRAGLNTEASFNNFTARVQLLPYAAWGSQKHQMVFGPILLVSSNIGFNTSKVPRLSGLNLGYRYWPGTTDKKWAFYLANDLRIQRVQDKWSGNFYDEQLLSYQEQSFRTVEVLIDYHMGYGVAFKLNNHMSINQGVGIGAYLSSIKGSNTIDTNTNFDFRGYGNFGFTWKVNFGLAYQF